MAKKIAKNKFISYPKSKRIAMKDCFTDYVPEIIVKKDIIMILKIYYLI